MILIRRVRIVATHLGGIIIIIGMVFNIVFLGGILGRPEIHIVVNLFIELEVTWWDET